MSKSGTIVDSNAQKFEIKASYASLLIAMFGFICFGLGNILAGTVNEAPGRISWILQWGGPLLLALAVTFHLAHLSYRIGRPAVVFLITGPLLLGLCTTPFLFDPELFVLDSNWSRLAWSLWAVGLLCLAAGFAAVAVHKERQVEHRIAQIKDVGDTNESDISVHASFFTLILASLGFTLYAAGYIQWIEVPGGNRWGWSLQVIGCVLLAVAIINHVEHLHRRIGKAAVFFAIVGALLLAISSLPYAINIDNVLDPFWGQSFWLIWGLGALCGAVSMLFIVVRKHSTAHLFHDQLN